MANIVNYQKFNYGSHTGFWWIYSFIINVHDWSYISCDTNQKISKSWRWTKYATQTGNWYKIFVIKHMCLIFSMCCTKGNFICWHKDVKHVSSITKSGFGEYLLEFHNIKKGTSYIYLVHEKHFLHMMLCLMKRFLVR